MKTFTKNNMYSLFLMLLCNSYALAGNGDTLDRNLIIGQETLVRSIQPGSQILLNSKLIVPPNTISFQLQYSAQYSDLDDRNFAILEPFCTIWLKNESDSERILTPHSMEVTEVRQSRLGPQTQVSGFVVSDPLVSKIECDGQSVWKLQNAKGILLSNSMSLRFPSPALDFLGKVTQFSSAQICEEENPGEGSFTVQQERENDIACKNGSSLAAVNVRECARQKIIALCETLKLMSCSVRTSVELYPTETGACRGIGKLDN